VQNDEEIRPLASSDNPLRREWGLEDRFVIGYSGNLGRGHEFETVPGAAKRVREDRRFCLLFIGGGKRFAELAWCVDERSLDRLFCFLPYRERSVLKFSFSVPDVHLISLRTELEGLIAPSQPYGIATAGRPIIALSNAGGILLRKSPKHRRASNNSRLRRDPTLDRR